MATTNSSVDLPYEVMKTAELILANILAPALTIVAILTNGMSLIVYSRLGLSDSISISFFTLTVSDFVFALTNMATLVVVIFMNPSVEWSVDPLAIAILLVPFNRMCYDLSNTLTCFIAVTRCCCVVMPLKFKSTFTRSRTFWVLGVIFTAFLIEFAPMFASQGLRSVAIPKTNSSRMVIWFARNRDEIAMVIYESLNRNALLIVTFGISLASLVLLTLKLKEASDFRRSLQSLAIVNDAAKGNTNKGKDGLNMSKVEIQIVKGVSLVLLITLSCNLPVLCISYSKLVVSEIALGRTYNNLYFLITNVSNFVIVVKTTFHWLVYYTFNSRYRLVFQSTLVCCRRPVPTAMSIECLSSEPKIRT